MSNLDFHYYMDNDMVSHLKPMNGQIIVQLRDDRDKHDSIILPTFGKPLVPDRGVVYAVSDDRKEKNIVVGSKVVFEKYMGKKIFTEDKTFLILHEDHIYLILPDDADVGIKYDCIL